jgi:hypothetical protein
MNDLPDDGSYMVAGYIVATVIYLAYTISLFVRARRAERGER